MLWPLSSLGLEAMLEVQRHLAGLVRRMDEIRRLNNDNGEVRGVRGLLTSRNVIYGLITTIKQKQFRLASHIIILCL
ncbi:hypothetical protein Plhal304r1_c052g0136611 [Plasmopara halstedii]